MSKSRTLVCLLCMAFVVTSLGYGATTPDRIAGDLNSGQKVQVIGNMHGYIKAENDLGRADGSRVIEGVSLNFRLSPAQQKDLDQFLVQLGDHSSPNFHKYLTIPQYAKRFGMSQNDLSKVVAWIQSQGFTNVKIAPTHNKISFDGTVAQIESLFAMEMHNYLVDGEVHLANATNPSVPAPLAGAILHIGHLNDIAPKPRVKVRSNVTSYVTGNHFLSPADFATIYDLNSLYSAGDDGTGQNIVIVGQSAINQTDINNFRSAAQLTASTVTMTLMEGTSTKCGGDETESDLDVEWSGGVAKGAKVTFLYAGLGTGDSCSHRFDSIWDALEDALTGTTTGSAGSPVAPFVSTSYGFCESGLGQNNVSMIRGWIQTGQTLGVTLVSASGDAGAADCDGTNEQKASQGLAVDAPASIPETTGAGGTEFVGDVAGAVTGTAPNTTAGATTYWGASGTGSDVVSTALSYIPEEGWNDTTANNALSASGGGASIYFSKPTWQNVTGVPSANARYVPDIALAASPGHDQYLICTEDTSLVTTGQCTAGFRDGAGGNFGVIGGTSAAAPTFTAIMTLINQYLGNTPPAGLAPINPTLYQLYPNNSTTNAFNDIQSGSNIVPCVSGTTGCPTTGTAQYGFNAGVGYDEVTGLGSVNGFALAQAWAATLTSFNISATTPSPTSIAAGNPTTSTVTIAPVNGFTGTVSFTCTGPTGVSCSGTSVTGGSGTSQVTIQTLANTPTGAATITIKGTSGGVTESTTVSVTVTATAEAFTLGPAVGTLSVSQGQTTGAVNMLVTNTGTPNFIVSSGSSTQTSLPVTYTCTGLPSESTCFFNGTQTSITSQLTSVTLTIQTTAPTTKLERPLDRGMRIFYAVLLPGLLGIVFTASSRKRAPGGMRVLGLILVLGFSTMWLASCGGSSGSSNKNPGTPVGSSTVTVNATTTGGPSSTLQFTLSVAAAAR